MGNKKVTDIILDEVSIVGKGANQKAHIVLMKSVTKREMNEDFPAAAFAYVPDAEKPSTWKLRLWDSLAEKETPEQVGRAVAALGKGFRGKKVQIPSEDLSKVKKKVLSAWLKVNTDKKRKDAPEVLKLLKMDNEGKTFNEIMEDKELREQMWNAVYILEDSIYSIMNDENLKDKTGKLNETIEQFQLKLVQINKGDIMGEIEKLTKQLEDLQAQFDDLQKAKEDLENQVSALTKEKEELLEKIKKDTPAEGIQKEDLPEEVRKRFEEMEKRDKENSELITKLLDEKENETYIAKAKGFKNLTLNPTEFGPILKKISKTLEKEEMDTFTKMLSSADEIIAKGKVFDEEGNGGGSQLSSAMAKMETMATELRKVQPNLTKEKALLKVMEQNPALYNEYLEEQAN